MREMRDRPLTRGCDLREAETSLAPNTLAQKRSGLPHEVHYRTKYVGKSRTSQGAMVDEDATYLEGELIAVAIEGMEIMEDLR